MILKMQSTPLFQNAQIFCTDRTGGFSSRNYESFNLGIKSGDEKLSVSKNRELLAEKIGKNRDNFIYLNQVHGGEVCILKKGKKYSGDGYDAIITDDKKSIPVILVADCVPIVVYDPIGEIIGVIHSGWKGTAENILGNTLQKMSEEFTCTISDIRVIIGPCISQKNYEVDEKVIKHFLDEFYTNNSGGGYQLDLRGIVEKQAKNAGVFKGNIYHIDICTFEREDLFFSARRDGYESGRFGMGIYFK